MSHIYFLFWLVECLLPHMQKIVVLFFDGNGIGREVGTLLSEMQVIVTFKKKIGVFHIENNILHAIAR